MVRTLFAFAMPFITSTLVMLLVFWGEVLVGETAPPGLRGFVFAIGCIFGIGVSGLIFNEQSKP